MSTHIVAPHCTHCAELERRIQALRWNTSLDMLNQAGLMDAIERLEDGAYTVVFCDIDRLKAINSATGSHAQTNRYLREGLRVRVGEIAGQLYGDEVVFILSAGDADAFIQRIARQLAEQPLTDSERSALAFYGARRLSATFASRTQVHKQDIARAIEDCSIDVLAQKARRPC